VLVVGVRILPFDIRNISFFDYYQGDEFVMSFLGVIWVPLSRLLSQPVPRIRPCGVLRAIVEVYDLETDYDRLSNFFNCIILF
jgi:hypothetical protein